jgi:hypothetical protein
MPGLNIIDRDGSSIIGASLTAYRRRTTDTGVGAAASAGIDSRPDRLIKKIANFDFILVAIRATGDLRGENGGQPPFDAFRGQSGAPNRMGLFILKPILTVDAGAGIPFWRGGRSGSFLATRPTIARIASSFGGRWLRPI